MTLIADQTELMSTTDSPPALTIGAGSTIDIGPTIESVLQTIAVRLLAARRLPHVTYRLQPHRDFTFRQAAAVVPYLAQLGITHVYVSPFLKAAPGSMHGYDIVDHGQLNPEVGTPDDFEYLVENLHAHGLGLIADVVPNHMCVSTNDNLWWMDVLENGPSSPYASFFDIDWMPLKPDLAHKVLLPVLGDQFGKVLEDQQLTLKVEDGTLFISYFDRRFPVAPRSVGLILEHRLEELIQDLGSEDPHLLEYQSILTAIRHLPLRTETSPERIQERRREKEIIKRRLHDLCQACAVVRAFLEENVRRFNGTRGDPASFDLLDALLQDQAYRLAYWRVAADEINYRRFFDVNDLAAISMEKPEVFEAAHQLILQYLAEGKIDGLRIDHADGLYDPTGYLLQLQRTRFRQLCREVVPAEAWDQIEPALLARFEEVSRTAPRSPLAHPLYVVAEKILEPGERLPPNWPVHGTTGYDYLIDLNGIFVERPNAKLFDGIYARFTRQTTNFRDLVYRCKMLIMQVSLSSEVHVLAHQLDRISEKNRRTRDFTLNSLRLALREIIACFPVYRTYTADEGVLAQDRRHIETAVARAKIRNPAINGSLFDCVRDILLLQFSTGSHDGAETAETRSDEQRFVRRFQQMTGPIMAKGLEDTAFYRYNRLTSLNEVGGSPEEFGTQPAEFHRRNRERLTHWPHALLATATHDTKRGEDTRARISVLSELPHEWKQHTTRWSRWNQRLKLAGEGDRYPSRNDEYLLYQTLVGTWPFEGLDADSRPAYIERIQQYMRKAVHEAKEHSSWINPNPEYDAALDVFIAAILTDSPRNQFLPDFAAFAGTVAQQGIWNSLSQTLLKLTSPGVPDIYQGTELWDFSLVDPDNRRAVDYGLRTWWLGELEARAADDDKRPALLSELLEHRVDGRIKLFLISQLLRYRRNCPGLFTQGTYEPLTVDGAHHDHLFGFLRRTPERAVLVLVPRLGAYLTAGPGSAPLGPAVWGDAVVALPADLPSSRFRNVLTGEYLTASDNQLAVADVLHTFPVALLEVMTEEF